MRSNRIAGLTAALLVLAVAHPGHGGAGGRGETRAQARAIAFARAQLGKPYVWGAEGPGAFDCSGLAMQAWRSAGRAIPRTSQQQWAALRHVSQPRPGDLVFFAGSDGTRAAPGHVGIVVAPNRMIEAYAPGFPIRTSRFGAPGSPGGDEAPVGYARP